MRVGGTLDPDVTRRFCSTTLTVNDFGRVQTGDASSAEIWLVAGLWVGAEVDRGSGVQQLVSESAYDWDFFADGWPTPHPRFQVILTDTVVALFPHEPLGLRVRQFVAPVDAGGAGVEVRWIVENISDKWRPPGWDMEHVYLGVMVDPDIGLASGFNPWQDDHVAFISGPGGDLAYAFDEPGNSDDTGARAGLLLPEQQAHAFQAWSWAADEATESGKYALLRGDSHDVPTIDPPTTVPNDYRMLLSIGPFTLPLGESRTLRVAFLCGDDLGTRIVRSADEAPAGVAVTRVVGSGSAIFFAGLPAASRVGIYDVMGRRVAELATGAEGEASWEVRTAGARVPAGVYFYRVSSPGPSATGKFVIAH